jgi:hypothetical protein
MMRLEMAALLAILFRHTFELAGANTAKTMISSLYVIP